MLLKKKCLGSVLFLFFLGCGNTEALTSHASSASTVQDDTNAANLLTVESEIFSAIQNAYVGDGLSAFDNIEAKLAKIPIDKGTTIKYYRNYWLAFLKYKKSIELMRAGRREESQAPLSQAIEILNGVDTLESEMHVLRALANGLYLQFAPREEVFSYIGTVNSSLAKSLEKDNTNIRAYYANAISDFNTPKEYGGGARAESLLNQALKLDNPEGVSPNPTWGRPESMALLVEVYLNSDRKEQAKTLFQQALSQYPDSVDIIELRKRF